MCSTHIVKEVGYVLPMTWRQGRIQLNVPILADEVVRAYHSACNAALFRHGIRKANGVVGAYHLAVNAALTAMIPNLRFDSLYRSSIICRALTTITAFINDN